MHQVVEDGDSWDQRRIPRDRTNRNPDPNREAAGRHESHVYAVVAARVVAEHVGDEQIGRVPEQIHAVHEIGHQQTGQDEVGLGPESTRQSDRHQRETVAAQNEHVKTKKDG